MKVKILEESGFESAILGLSLSFYDHKIPLLDWDKFDSANKNCGLFYSRSDNDNVFWTDEKFQKAQKIALHISHKKGNDEIRNNDDYIRAEKKFLRQIVVYIYIQAPRSFWSEYSTYQIGNVSQSSSTMHTLSKRHVTLEDFEEGCTFTAMNNLNMCIDDYNNTDSINYHDVTRLKDNLPESWLQERLITTNYAVLQNIINQRAGHRLKYWKIHNDAILEQIEHPELLACVKVDK